MSTEKPPAKLINTSFLDLVGLLVRRKWIVLLTTVGGTLLVFGLMLASSLLPVERSFLPNYYIPTANVLVDESASGGLQDLLSTINAGSLSTITSAAKTATSAGLVKRIAITHSFLNALAEELGFVARYGTAKRARGVILENLSLTSDASSGMITIGYKSTDPEEATRLVNRAVDLLAERFSYLALGKYRSQIEQLTAKLAELETDMERIQRELDRVHAKYNTLDFSATAREQINRLAAMRSELLQKNLEIDSYRSFATIQDPNLQRLRMESDGLRASIRRLESGYNDNGIVVPPETELPQLLKDYTQLRSELEVKKKIFETLTQQYELTRLEAESSPSVFLVYERAYTPEDKAGPRRSRICVIGAFASLVLGLLAAFLVDYLLRVLRNPGNVRKMRGLSDEK